MKKRIMKPNGILVLLMFIVIHIQSGFGQCSKLVWADEFTGTGLNTADWTYEIGRGNNGWGNSELQYYTDLPQNATIINGKLAIIARNQPNYLGSGANYTSARLKTAAKQNWKYGRIEAKIKIPSADKIWPAFWMLPESGNWPFTGEIDIMEAKGINPREWLGTLHYNSNGHKYTGVNYTNPTALSDDFHTYAVEWEPSQIRFYVDSTLRGTLTPSSLVGNAWPFDSGNNFFIILNVAVGGNFVGGGIPNTSLYPDTMFVDWVRVHRIPSGLNITGPKVVSQGDKGKTYNPNDFGPNATYQWTTSPVASITATNLSNGVSTNWGTSSTTGLITVTVTPQGCNAPFSKSLLVNVIPITCSRALDDYDNIRNIGSYQGDGAFNIVNNPASNSVNSSAKCVQYDRNGGVQYDVLSANDFFLGEPADFVSGARKFSLDVYSSVAANTNISIQMEATSKNTGAYPAGRHSIYTGVTGQPNTWNRIYFNYSTRPDNGTLDSDVDVLKILFNPNSNTSTTYYFDNLQYYSPVSTSAINGNTSVCINTTNSGYSVTPKSGSTYNWTYPITSTLVSGLGSASIILNWATTGGNVQVVETDKFNCVGNPVTKAVTISPCTATSWNESIEESGKIFPNPFQNKLTFQNLNQMKSMKINSMDGRTLWEYEIAAPSFELDLNALETGVYVLVFKDVQGNTTFKKVIKN